jgi:two-component system, response regulator YesN
VNVESISKTLFELIQTPIYVHDEGQLVLRLNTIKAPENLRMNLARIRAFLIENAKPEHITRIKDDTRLIFTCFIIENRHITIGPFLDREFDAAQLYHINAQFKLIDEQADATQNLFETMRILTPDHIRFIHQTYYAMLGLSPRDALIKTINYKNAFKTDTDTDADVDEAYELEYVKRNYDTEDRFLSIVERGDVEEAKTFDTTEIMKELPKRSHTDMLRNTKTRLTILNTLCNRAAIKGGITIFLGHQISTNYGIMIENMRSAFDSAELERNILVSYSTAVWNYSLSKHSKTVAKAITYIRRTITSRITLDGICDATFVTKEHLARTFKKEMGISVMDYVNLVKIHEAKKMLTHKGYTITDISQNFAFSNSSHFSRIFHRIEGMTPSEYRIIHLTKMG